jgi:uncharacterized protein YkwD
VRCRVVMLAIALLLSGRSGLAEAPIEWASETASPRPGPGSIGARDSHLVSSCLEGDAGLVVVAGRLARHEIVASDVEAVAYALHAAGEPHVWPRAIALEGRTVDRRDARGRIERWLADFRHQGHLRCATASAESGGRETVAAVAVDAQADLAPIVLVARPSSWIDVEARVLVPATQAKVVMLGPTGVPRALPTSFAGGRVKARANVDQPGAWLFQVVVDGEGGPRPVLEAFVFAGVAPPRARPSGRAPGEELDASGDAATVLGQMIAVARASEGMGSLRRSAVLDRAARAHAEHMMRAGELRHDLGDGDARERVQNAGVDADEIGENVAHAATLALAHRALWASPSHRDNVLGRRFTRFGVGAIRDADGSIWVTEVFASPR